MAAPITLRRTCSRWGSDRDVATVLAVYIYSRVYIYIAGEGASWHNTAHVSPSRLPSIAMGA